MGLDMYLEDEKGEELAYWRKSNAIHAWFVHNVQGGVDECQRSSVPLEKILELKEVLNAILDDNSKAEDMLPCKSGFFFGSTEYDEWYFDSLRYTKEVFERIIINPPECIYYQASW